MKRKDKEALKAMSAAEHGNELLKRREELFKLRFAQGAAPRNPLLRRTLKREIARLLTWMHAAKGREAQN
jgi:ribosomal protein L29